MSEKSTYSHCPRCGQDLGDYAVGKCLACGWPNYNIKISGPHPRYDTVQSLRGTAEYYEKLWVSLKFWAKENFGPREEGWLLAQMERLEGQLRTALGENENKEEK